MGRQGHTFLHEAGGVSVLGGVVIHTVPNQANGTIALQDLEAALRNPEDAHEPISKLVILENTQNACGGVPISLEYTRSAADFARKHKLLLHLDGARIFNASVALGKSASELAAPADSVTFCLSKGLCAPVGSVLCGNADFIHKAHRLRKILGGGMRQAGIIAAAGIVALESMVDRLAEDHANARRLAGGIALIPGLATDPARVQTNILYLDLTDRRFSDEDFLRRLAKKGLRLSHTAPARFRMLTHYGIEAAHIDKALAALRSVMEG